MKIIFRLEHVILNFGLYKIQKEDYPILNYSSEYLDYSGWGENDIDLAWVGNSAYALRKVNERLLIMPYAKVDKYLKRFLENGHKIMFVSALNENFCSDFLRRIGLDDAIVIHNKERLDIPTEETVFVSADLEEVSELCQSKNVYGVAALWGTTDWLNKDFEVNGVLEKIEDFEDLLAETVLQEHMCQAISKWMKSDLLKFRNDDRDTCINHIMKILVENGLAKKSRDRVVLVDHLEKDWNNPFLPYVHINVLTDRILY